MIFWFGGFFVYLFFFTAAESNSVTQFVILLFMFGIDFGSLWL